MQNDVLYIQTQLKDAYFDLGFHTLHTKTKDTKNCALAQVWHWSLELKIHCLEQIIQPGNFERGRVCTPTAKERAGVVGEQA
jgi:hypothetical protein